MQDIIARTPWRKTFLCGHARIGLLSDTHGWLDPRSEDHFTECDEIWHAGDIGGDGWPKS